MFCAQCGQWIADGESACARCGAPAHGTAIGPLPAAVAAPAGPAAPAVQYAGFWRRFATGLVDGVVVFFPISIARVLLGDDPFSAGTPWDDPSALRGALVNVGFWWIYCAALECSGAQGTLGQQLLGLRVFDGRFRRISFARATARHFAQWLSVFTCGLGYLVNLWTKKRQTLHDLVAGCVIVRAESLPGPAPAPGGNP
jgi:uncharacterized RDD family membrane protein YckC